jgi:O-antigen/teichoic acid export membrane protein
LSLIKKSISGTIWTFLDIAFNKSIYFFATLILARILGPNEFGLMGMILIFYTIGNTLIESGLTVSIIRTSNPDEVDYSTLYYMNLAISFIAYFIIFISGSFIANFYNQPILESLVKIYCLGFIVNAFRMIPNAILVKEMNFKKIALLNVPGNLIGLGLGIYMALNGYKVWSIVGLYLSTQIVTTLMYWMFVKWKPLFKFSKSKMKYHWGFGYKLMLSAQLNSIFDNIYNILIGKFYSVESLGYYERAYTLNNYPISVLSGIISKVTLPLLSKLADDKKKTKIVYRKLLMLTFYISAPLMLGLFVIAKPLFLLFLGDKWLEAVPFFQILCLGYFLYPIHSLNITILSVYGKSNLFLKLEIIKKLVVLILVFSSLNFGIYGLVWSSVIASFVALFINSFYSGKLIFYNTKSQLMDLMPTFIISLFMAIFMRFIYLLFENSDNYMLSLILPSIAGFCIFSILSFFTKNESMHDIFVLFKKKSIL